MPRGPSGSYTYPDGTRGISGQTIYSARYNTFLDDLATTLNTALPVNMGGTGGTTVVQARDNLDVEVSMQTVTNYDTHAWETGSFKSDLGAVNSPEGAGAAAARYAGSVQVYDGDKIVVEARPIDGGQNLTYVRRKSGTPGVWGAWTLDGGSGAFVLKAGDTMTGNLTLKSNSPAVVLNKQLDTGGGANDIFGVSKDKSRWLLRLGNAAPEDGATNAGSDFELQRFADNGTTMLSSALTINRKIGSSRFSGPVAANLDPTLLTNVNSGQVIGGNASMSGFGFAMNAYLDTTPAWRFISGSAFASRMYLLGDQLIFDVTSGIGGSDNALLSSWAQSLIMAPTAFFFNRTVNVTNNGAYVDLNTTAVAGGMGIRSTVNNNARWNLYLGDGTPELGSNGGSNLVLKRYSDAGAYLGDVLHVTRSNGNITITPATVVNNVLYVRANAAATNAMLIYQDNNSVNKALSFWDATSGSAVFTCWGNAAHLEIGNNSIVTAGNGIKARAGIGGATSNAYNFYWTGSVLQAWIDSGNIGNVSITSDYRVKKDIADLHTTWETVKALRPISYTQAEFKPPSSTSAEPLFAADDIQRWGFVAHELQETLIQSAATGVKDDPVNIQSPNPWTVIAALTKALQEAMERIEALEKNNG